MLVYKAGAYIVYWRDRARLDYKIAGIALWTLGQEDVRVWNRLAAGELTSVPKRLDR